MSYPLRGIFGLDSRESYLCRRKTIRGETGDALIYSELTVVTREGLLFVHFGGEPDVGKAEPIAVESVDHFDASVGHVDAVEIISNVPVSQISGE